jgi:hypothetical protein
MAVQAPYDWFLFSLQRRSNKARQKLAQVLACTAIFVDNGKLEVLVARVAGVSHRPRDKEIMVLQRLRDWMMVLNSSAGVVAQRATTTDRTRKR